MKLAFSAALLALLSAPALAGADDDDADVAPPSSVEPAPPSAPPPADPQPPADDGERWCHGHQRWGSWHHGPYASRFAIGLAHGHYELAADEGRQKALLARVGLHHGFEVELEMARTALDAGDELRTGGAALVKTFGHRHFRPYVLAGLGGGRIAPDTGADTHLGYAELGGGLMLRGRHLAIGVDVRRGMRHLETDDAMATTAAKMTPSSDETRERYTRARILALVYF